MPTVTRRLPPQPHLDVPKQEARELLQQSKLKSTDALDRVRRRHPRFEKSDDETIATQLKLSGAQLVVAREYAFASWTQLKDRIAGNTAAQSIQSAIYANDSATVVKLLVAHPKLLHLPVRSGHWGPPMSFAANLGLLDMIKAVALLGATDYQYAFDRALLQGQVESARWLHEHGAVFAPGIFMGCCETLNDRGFGFLDDAGVPLMDEKKNPLAPLAMVLETYSRNPAGKHAILQRFRKRNYHWADTPMMAFHCGNLDRLKIQLQNDPSLIHRRFSYREIFPPELGCHDDLRSGLHGTPIAGTTLLHLAIDYDEREIFDWLLEQGADVNAAAVIDDEGFGGHTPPFNAMVSMAYANGRQQDAYMVRRLLEGGADLSIRANLRKYLDWQEEPGWFIANNATPLDWAANFPIRDWVNQEGLSMIENIGKS